MDGCTSIDHLVVSDCEFSDMNYGIILFNSYPNPSTATNIEIRDTVFTRNAVKGFYAEKLSEANFRRLTVTDNGDLDHTPYYWAGNNAGIDVNLKHGSYQNLLFENLTVSGNGRGSYAGAGLTVKARGSGTGNTSVYTAQPATLNGVLIKGGSYSGNEVGIRFGELNGPSSATGYTDPSTFSFIALDSPTNVSLQGVSITGNVRAQLLNLITGLSLPGEVRTY